MKFKLTGIIEAKSRKDALRKAPGGFAITEISADVEVKSDLEFSDKDGEWTIATFEGSTEFKPSKGVNIEGLARQRDLNKLTNSVIDIVSTGPHASKEDMDKLVKRIERLEMTAVPLEEEYNGDRHYLVNDTVINPDGSKHRAIDAKPPCPFDEVARFLSAEAQESLDKAAGE